MRPQKESVRLLSIEDSLAQDSAGAERDRIIERLRVLEREARAVLDKGVPPSQADDLRALLVALDAAQTVVSRVWSRLHQRGR